MLREKVIKNLLNIYPKALLVCFALLMAIVSLELFLRLTKNKNVEPVKCRQEESFLAYSLVPNKTCRFKRREWDVTYKINSQGQRDNEYFSEKPENNYRILMLGDSLTEGFGVELNETFSKQIEKSLNNTQNNQN